MISAFLSGVGSKFYILNISLKKRFFSLKPLGYLVFSLLFCSCISDVEIDVPEQESVFVLQGLFCDGDTLELFIGQSQTITDTLFYLKDDIVALVTSANNGIDTLFSSDEDGYYKSSKLLVKQGVEYSIQVIGANNDTVTATNSVPITVDWEIGNYTQIAGNDIYGDTYSSFTISFQDSVDSEDYYAVVGYYDSGEQLYLWSDDPLINADDFTNEYADSDWGNILYFSDALFDGENVSITFNFYYEYDSDVNRSFSLRHISYDYYKYMTTANLHYDNQEFSIWNGAGNPVNMYTNVDGGYGVFAGYSETTKEVDLSNY